MLTWTILPATTAARALLTLVLTLLAPLVLWILVLTLRQSPAGRRVLASAPVRGTRRGLVSVLTGLVLGLRGIWSTTGLARCARWLHGKPWRRRRRPEDEDEEQGDASDSS